jgi:long-chain acyl-CoA synthetase
MDFATVVEAIRHYAKHAPGKTCLVDADVDRTCAYGELWTMAAAFSERMKRAGLQKGGRVVVRVGGFIETMTAQLGIYLAGGVYCPIEKNAKTPLILEMMEYYDAEILISSEKVNFGGLCTDLQTVCAGGGFDESKIAMPNPEDLCAIVFTTGTTGKSKGVMISYRAVTATAILQKKAYASGIEIDVLQYSSLLERQAGVRLVSYPLFYGGAFVFCKGTVFAQSFLGSIKKYGVNQLIFIATQLNILLNNYPQFFFEINGSVKYIVSGGSLMPDNCKNRIKKILTDTKFYIQYASTEVYPICRCEVESENDSAQCVGLPVPNTEVHFVNEQGETVKTSKDHCGIFACKNDSMMMGYWKSPELTAKTIQNGYVIMADCGYAREDGLMCIAGRKDDVINSGGFKISPYEVEAAASEMPEIEECACVAVDDRLLGQIPKLYVKVRGGAEFSAKATANFLSLRLEQTKIPRYIEQVDDFPRVGSKINRKVLKDNV